MIRKLFPKADDAFTMVLSGSRRVGKTTLIKKLLSEIYADGFDAVYIIYPAEMSDKHPYKDFNIAIGEHISVFTTETLDNIIEKQLKILELDPKFRSLLVLDDCLAEKGMKSRDNTDALNKIFIRGRHMNFSIIVASQVYRGLSQTVRTNTDTLIYMDNMADHSILLQEKRFMTDLKDCRSVIKAATSSKFGYLILSIFDKKNVSYYNSDTDKFYRISCQ